MGQPHASGHLQIKGPRGKRGWFALWRDANGRHQKSRTSRTHPPRTGHDRLMKAS
jgi:hypothetical protein